MAKNALSKSLAQHSQREIGKAEDLLARNGLNHTSKALHLNAETLFTDAFDATDRHLVLSDNDGVLLLVFLFPAICDPCRQEDSKHAGDPVPHGGS